MDLAIPFQHVRNLLCLRHFGVYFDGVVLGKKIVGLLSVILWHFRAVVQDACNPWNWTLTIATWGLCYIIHILLISINMGKLCTADTFSRGVKMKYSSQNEVHESIKSLFNSST